MRVMAVRAILPATRTAGHTLIRSSFLGRTLLLRITNPHPVPSIVRVGTCLQSITNRADAVFADGRTLTRCKRDLGAVLPPPGRTSVSVDSL
jgi:hypothetical protein